jgi:heptosyltransferase-2
VKEEYAEVVRHDPAVGHVRQLERDARRIEDLVSMSAELESCDLIVDLHGNTRTRVLCFRQPGAVLRAARERLRRARWVHARWSRPAPVTPTVTRYARTLEPIGVSVDSLPRLAVPVEAQRWAEETLAAGGGEPWVAFCPAALHATKRWPEAYWVELLGAVVRRARVMVLSLARERDALPGLAAAVEREPRALWRVDALPRAAALLGRAQVAVSSDSGLMHVAAARGVRVVALFGSTSPALGFAPAGEGHVILCRYLPCQPCTLHGRERCPLGHFRCMLGIAVSEVEAAVARQLESHAGVGAGAM